MQFNLKDKEIMSFVGGGGKTTTIGKLAKELKQDGKSILCTTSTAIDIPSSDSYDKYFIGCFPEDYIPVKGSVTVYGEFERNGKLRTKNLALIEEIINRNIFDYVLIEADGARCKPIKAPNEHEPVISNLTTTTVGVIGLDCIGKRVDEIVHRPEIFMELFNVTEDHLIDFNDIVRLVKHEKGLFKNNRGRRVLLLNKVRNEQMDIALKITAELEGEIEVIIGEYVFDHQLDPKTLQN